MTKTGKSQKHAKLENYCKYCTKIIIGSSYKFNSHMFKHNAVQERYSCEFCLKKFFRKDAYKSHMNTHMGVVTPKRYTCDYCDRGFVIKNNLISHLKRIHDENLNSELGKFMCNICDLSYSERRLLDQHIRRVHFNMQLSKEPLHTNKLINETWIENVNNTNATVSITKINNNIIVIKKLKIDVKVDVAKPNVIDFKSECQDQYSKGICDYCKKEMVKKNLRTHIKEVHMNIRKFKCKVCRESFSRHYQMVEHKCGHFKSKKRRIIKKKDTNKSKKKRIIKKNDIKIDTDSKLFAFKKDL